MQLIASFETAIVFVVSYQILPNFNQQKILYLYIIYIYICKYEDSMFIVDSKTLYNIIHISISRFVSYTISWNMTSSSPPANLRVVDR